MKSSKLTFAITNILVTLLFVLIPIIIFASFSCFPGWSKPTQIIFWILFIICPLVNIGWVIYVCVKPHSEITATLMQIVFNFALQVLPLVNLIFTVFPKSWSWIVVFPLLIDLIVIVSYVIVMLFSSHWSKKVNNTMQRVQATSHTVVNQDTAFNNDDGSFKGSRLKK